jgi:hypothetical protein
MSPSFLSNHYHILLVVDSAAEQGARLQKLEALLARQAEAPKP